MTINAALSLLGKTVEDKITGLTGIVTCIDFDLYGCIQAIVATKVNKNGEIPASKWMDVGRLRTLDAPDAMPNPFTEWLKPTQRARKATAYDAAAHVKGPAEKPLP